MRIYITKHLVSSFYSYYELMRLCIAVSFGVTVITSIVFALTYRFCRRFAFITLACYRFTFVTLA